MISFFFLYRFNICFSITIIQLLYINNVVTFVSDLIERQTRVYFIYNLKNCEIRGTNNEGKKGILSPPIAQIENTDFVESAQRAAPNICCSSFPSFLSFSLFPP